MNICGIDIGKKGGIAIYNGEKFETIEHSFVSMKTTYELLCKIFKDVDAVIVGEAFGHRQVVKYQAKFYGIIELICETLEIPVVYKTDNTMRKEIFGAGNGRNKEMVHKHYKGSTPDVSDAMLFSFYLYKFQ